MRDSALMSLRGPDRAVDELVLLPGLDGTSRLFTPLWEALPPSLAVLPVTYPNDCYLGYDELQQIVEQSVASQGNYALLAESFSGPIAIALAARQPNGLQALILSTSFAANPIHPALRWSRFLKISFALRTPLLRFLVRRFFLDRQTPAPVVDEAVSTIRSVPPKVVDHRFRMIHSVDVRSSLPKVGIPVLYLAGSSDLLIGLRGCAQVREHLPNFSQAILEGPHFLLQSKPHEAAPVIMRFLSRSRATLVEEHHLRRPS